MTISSVSLQKEGETFLIDRRLCLPEDFVLWNDKLGILFTTIMIFYIIIVVSNLYLPDMRQSLIIGEEVKPPRRNI